MKYLTTAFLCSIFSVTAYSQAFVTSDIDNFWNAYDHIKSTNDSAQQYGYIQKLYIDKGTPGLKAIMQARRYSPQSYINAIKAYPAFWAAVRRNTAHAGNAAEDIAAGVARLKKLYPQLRPATVYFTIGALRTNGTIRDSMVLIGSELAMADPATPVFEFPSTMSHLKPYFATDPAKHLAFLNVHEYVHTQQKTSIGDNLLVQCVLEGAAEFLAVKAMDQASPTPAIAYGKANDAKVKARFLKEIYSPYFYNWLWNSPDNAFKIRDLGYYIGYAICEAYYNKAQDKQQAIAEMITLDYNNANALNAFVDKSGYFGKTTAQLMAAYEAGRPVVSGIKQFTNGDTQVSPQVTQVTLVFSQPMDPQYRNFDFGPLGKDALLSVKKFNGFSDDKLSATFEVAMEPGKHYQLLIGEGFRSVDGVPLKPYLVEITTAK
ncbi:MAG: hypothetical protein J0I41_22145 [Filimonas sp.]|nr:hypothetical protein [Filimonas sp.]